VGQVCYYENAGGDGCYEHSCVEVPPVCEADPTCACIEAAYSHEGLDCTQASGTLQVEGAVPPPW